MTTWAMLDLNVVLQISSDVRQAKFSRKAGALRRAGPGSTPCFRKAFGLTHVQRNLQYMQLALAEHARCLPCRPLKLGMQWAISPRKVQTCL